MKAIKDELEIKKVDKYKVLDERREMLKMRIINNKLKNHEFQDNEKIIEIKRENKKLLDKLYDISQGKKSTILGHSASQIVVVADAVPGGAPGGSKILA